MKIISSVDVRDIAEILEEYISDGQPRMAQVIRSVLIDVFKEAQHFGRFHRAITLPRQQNSHGAVSRASV